MNFAHPEAFLLLVLFPIYGLLHWRLAKPQGLPLSTFKLLYNVRQRLLWQEIVPPVLYMLGIVLMICALARPQYGQEIVKKKQAGIDIILALDTSGSMLAEDFAPNRLESAKSVIKDFIKGQTNNRIGVVVFAGRSFTLLPLTTDYQMAIDTIDEVHPKMVRQDGTAIGLAIVNATYRFKDDNKNSRVVILLTDGDNNVGSKSDPIDAAKIANQKNIRIYTIGMGTSAGAPLLMSNPSTGRKSYVRDRQGNIVYLKVNESDLKEIARLTDGQYFNADKKNKLDAIYSQIASMEKTEFEVRKSTIYLEQMHIFLWPGLLALLLAFILSHSVAQVIKV